ncbi:Saccharopine dehydrogenase NADP binding domain-containing protein [Tistlia consotensis]|uniref:Saccharopine dehydrogenase NADP binding domain-containing protein n=1 Tax=Tistlia consotensis USBA 355 TaxID=560819 RepID=A0A1Y6B308_9PROT|nr:saccharopine dehydrogenase NADP-binding domain-containing protein [Tistlia consotensis]SME88807.1 Saccharopine dehydrogenase NADP binding domain-containing protein [Tistlia consotensis USBA 355]SNR25344.1 Saccharopine dehydrogenase NADP binding domain-containing protein [Tistlia consotensis]
MIKRHRKVVVFGAGELGGIVVELLARHPSFRGEIVLADLDSDRAWRRANSAQQGALQWGCETRVRVERADLRDVAGTAELLARLDPDLVFNATTLATWWLRDLLPEAVKQRLHVVGAGSGVWSASHAALAYNLMRAVRDSGIRTVVVNSSYPDGVNPALAAAGLAPDVGIGNGDLLVPALQQVVAAQFGVPCHRVGVTLVAHHFHAYNILMHGHAHGLDFPVRISVDGRDVSDRVERAALFAAVPDVARIPGAAAATWIVAASAIRILTALLEPVGRLIHAPGPLGLVGGYPLQVDESGVALALPEGLGRDEAVAINWEAQRAEGIEAIEADGTIVLTDVAAGTLKEVFGYECRRYPLDDCLAIARELTAALRALGERHGLALQTH